MSHNVNLSYIAYTMCDEPINIHGNDISEKCLRKTAWEILIYGKNYFTRHATVRSNATLYNCWRTCHSKFRHYFSEEKMSNFFKSLFYLTLNISCLKSSGILGKFWQQLELECTKFFVLKELNFSPVWAWKSSFPQSKCQTRYIPYIVLIRAPCLSSLTKTFMPN